MKEGILKSNRRQKMMYRPNLDIKLIIQRMKHILFVQWVLRTKDILYRLYSYRKNSVLKYYSNMLGFKNLKHIGTIQEAGKISHHWKYGDK